MVSPHMNAWLRIIKEWIIIYRIFPKYWQYNSCDSKHIDFLLFLCCFIPTKLVNNLDNFWTSVMEKFLGDVNIKLSEAFFWEMSRWFAECRWILSLFSHGLFTQEFFLQLLRAKKVLNGRHCVKKFKANQLLCPPLTSSFSIDYHKSHDRIFVG